MLGWLPSFLLVSYPVCLCVNVSVYVSLGVSLCPSALCSLFLFVVVCLYLSLYLNICLSLDSYFFFSIGVHAGIFAYFIRDVYAQDTTGESSVITSKTTTIYQVC